MPHRRPTSRRASFSAPTDLPAARARRRPPGAESPTSPRSSRRSAALSRSPAEPRRDGDHRAALSAFHGGFAPQVRRRASPLCPGALGRFRFRQRAQLVGFASADGSRLVRALVAARVQPIAGPMWAAKLSSRCALYSTPSWLGTVSSRVSGGRDGRVFARSRHLVGLADIALAEARDSSRRSGRPGRGASAPSGRRSSGGPRRS